MRNWNRAPSRRPLDDRSSRLRRLGLLPFRCPVLGCCAAFERQDSVGRHVRSRAHYEEVNAGVPGGART